MQVGYGFLDVFDNKANGETAFSVSFLSPSPIGMGLQGSKAQKHCGHSVAFQLKKRNSWEIISELGWVASACTGWGIPSAQIISPGFVVTFPHTVLGCCLRDTECSHLRCSRFSTAFSSVSAKQTPPLLVAFWFMLPNLGSRAWAPCGCGCCCCGCDTCLGCCRSGVHWGQSSTGPRSTALGGSWCSFVVGMHFACKL